jgi:uncharacterized membrane protein
MSSSTATKPSEDAIREAAREARTHAAVAVAGAAALLVGLAAVDTWRDWSLLGLPWWTWLTLAVPEATLLLAFLVWGSRDLVPGRRRQAVIVMLAFLAVASLVATVVLIVALVGASTDQLSAGDLLVHALVVWLTNLIVFGLLFWELDAGGPVRRAIEGRATPDFQFPQDENRELARPGWRAGLADYTYLSLTNAMAFSPTDAMPLSRQAKGLMAAESLLSNIIVVLVIARAVNVFGSG